MMFVLLVSLFLFTRFFVMFCLLYFIFYFFVVFFFSSRRRHTSCLSDWSSEVCSSDLGAAALLFWAAACSHGPTAPSTPVGSPFRIGVGQSVRIESAGLEIGFERVLEDSRCPADARSVDRRAGAESRASGGETP